ncbi:MAG: PAS domain S-box protein [Syntrophorhabdales bacterium]|jgi:PAS domain S-box-containing protein
MKERDKTERQTGSELTRLRRRIALLEARHAGDREVEKRLRESEKKYRLLFENAGDAILLMREDRLVDCNSRTLGMFGCTKEQIIGQPPYRFSPSLQPDGGDSQEKALERIHAAMAGVPQFFEWEHCRCDGTPFDAEVSLNSLELAGDIVVQAIIRDITERKQAGRMLLQNEELYRDVVENVGDGIAITVDTERVFVNRAFLAIHGLRDASEAVGRPLDRFVFPEDQEAVRKRVIARQRGESLDKLAEYKIRRGDGEIRTVQASVVTTTYKGRPATLAVLRDITAVKQAETEIMRLNAELERRVLDLRNANDELEAFNSTVSHDLRTPLMIIEAFSERILKKYRLLLDDRFADLMGAIRTNVVKAGRLIDDLLAYARLGKEALQRAPVRMDALAASVVDELRSLYPEGDVTISPLPPCAGDERMIRQAFANLVSNAFKFSSRREHRLIEIGGWDGGEENAYFIRDNGAGFDMAEGARLFTVFQRLHSGEEFKGTGMGLAIVKRIVGLHGGRVWAEGAPGRGATFYITLPKADRPGEDRE